MDILWRIRPLAMVAVETEMMRALEISANKYLGDRVAAILEHLHDPSSPPTEPPTEPPSEPPSKPRN